MSDDVPVIPEEVPEFTGDLELLEQNITGVRSAGTSLKDSGSAIHTRFGGLSAYYRAPEAEALFATTAPVAAKGDEFSTELETVASALDTYAAAVGPLKQKFDQLRQDAIAFRNRIAGDDEWRADGDLVEENNNRRSDINAAYAAFQAAERDCYNKIVALVGGEQLVVDDGSGKENMYGYRGEDLDNAGGLPWGDPVEESNPWYYIHEHAWDFAVGFVVDGVWGTIKGLGTLVGFSGWDAAGQAWVGLGKLATGIVITAVPVVGTAYWLAPDDKLPSWLRDSRTAVVETGKALIAYDEWGRNPSRAAGAVTFNVLTTIFTGGAGGAVSGAGKAGAVARAISFAGRAGRIVDPMTYITKGVGATAVKISDVMAGLRGITDGTHIRLGEGTYRIADPPNITDDLPAGLTPENSVRMETPKGDVVYLNTETLVMHNADGTVRESLDGIKQEGTAAERGADVSRPETELVGAGARVGDGGTALGRVGENGLPGGRADDLGRGPVGSHETPGGGGSRGGDGPAGGGSTRSDGQTGGGHGETPSGGRGETPGGVHSETSPGGHGDGPAGGGHGDGPAGGGHGDGPGGDGPDSGDGPGSGDAGSGGGDGPGGGGGGGDAGSGGGTSGGDGGTSGGDGQPMVRGGDTEQQIRDTIKGIPGKQRPKPDVLERALARLADEPNGQQVAEIIASGRFNQSDEFGQVVSSLGARKTQMFQPGADQIVFANALADSGVPAHSIDFEVKVPVGSDLDIRVKDASGEVYGYQMKHLNDPADPIKEITRGKYLLQLAKSEADHRILLVDGGRGTVAGWKADGSYDALMDVHRGADGPKGEGITFVVRLEDGTLTIPPGSKTDPKDML